MALALINAFSQLGNVAGSYVWDLKDDGYRKSYGIVTAMFGVTIIGCLAFRVVLANLNKELEAQAGMAERTAEDQDESLRMHKGFRYLV